MRADLNTMRKYIFIFVLILNSQSFVEAQQGSNIPQPYYPPNNSMYLPTLRMYLLWESQPQNRFHVLQYSFDSLFTPDATTEIQNLGRGYGFIDTLLNDITYYWRVRREEAQNEWSEVWNFRTTPLPVVPLLLSPQDSIRNLDTTVTLEWTKDTVNIFYRLQLTYDSTLGFIAIDTMLAQNSITFNDVGLNIKYFWRVKSFNVDSAASDWSDISSFKTRLAAPVLQFPAQDSVKVPLNVELQWFGSTGADTYYIKLSTDSLFISLYLDTTTASAHLQLDSLDADTTFYWRIYAANAEGDSSHFSETFKFKTIHHTFFGQRISIDTVNLSVKEIDTLSAISLINRSKSPFRVDSVVVTLNDSIFYLQVKSFVVPPDSSYNFYLKFYTDKVKNGINKTRIRFTRINESEGNDSLSFDASLFLMKAVAEIKEDTLLFDSVNYNKNSYRDFFLNNFKGNYTLIIDSIFISGKDSAYFNVFMKVDSILGGGSGYFALEFRPEKFGMNEAELVMETNSYPNKILRIKLFGSGKGGVISETTIQSLQVLSSKVFEAVTDNYDNFLLINSGSDKAEIKISFAKNYFKLTTDSLYHFFLDSGDSVVVPVKYIIPNFKTLNLDTIKISHDGFGINELEFELRGSFDSTKSVTRIREKLTINEMHLPIPVEQFRVDSRIVIKLDTLEFRDSPALDFRVPYFKGGPGDKLYAVHTGKSRYLISESEITHRGIIFYGELVVRNNDWEVVDSINVFNLMDPQIIVINYTTPQIIVPRSIPAETADKANTKWVFFGFPFREIPTDRIFKFFGGVENMADGEWVLYQYNPAAPGSFSLFKANYIQPNSALYFVQGLVDTFIINHTFEYPVTARRLTDTVITVEGEGWRTISSPFTFDVEVQPPVMLRRFDTVNRSYRLTNTMRPGEGYFVEPGVNEIRVKTFGKYYPMLMPKIINDIGWYLSLKVEDSKSSGELLFSVKRNEQKLSRQMNADEQLEYLTAPNLERGLEYYIVGSDGKKKSAASIVVNQDGGEWEAVIVNSSYASIVKVNAEIASNIPQDFNSTIIDLQTLLPIDTLMQIELEKKSERRLKIIIGTKEFINEKLNSLTQVLPQEFAISQNFPNPFNPVTKIKYQLPKDNHVTIKVFNILGEEITTLVNESKQTGYYEIEFNGRSAAGGLASGVYLYRIEAGEFVSVKKMVLAK
jgi:hypothetical protein